MGRSYLFECPKCGYKDKVSGGGDAGFAVWVQTILCRDCKKLYDAVIRLKVPVSGESALLNTRPLRAGKSKATNTPPSFEKVLHRLPFPGRARYQWAQYGIRCPVSALHKVHVWKSPGKCPRCGVYLEKNALPFRIWD